MLIVNLCNWLLKVHFYLNFFGFAQKQNTLRPCDRDVALYQAVLRPKRKVIPSTESRIHYAYTEVKYHRIKQKGARDSGGAEVGRARSGALAGSG